MPVEREEAGSETVDRTSSSSSLGLRSNEISTLIVQDVADLGVHARRLAATQQLVSKSSHTHRERGGRGEGREKDESCVVEMR